MFIHYFRESPEVVAALSGESGEPNVPGLSLYYSMQRVSADRIVEEITRAGGRADCWEADLGNADAVPELFDRVEQSLGPATVLVNNAASYKADTFLPAQQPGN